MFDVCLCQNFVQTHLKEDGTVICLASFEVVNATAFELEFVGLCIDLRID